MDLQLLNYAHAVPTGLMTVAVAKIYTSANGLEAPLQTQLEAGIIAAGCAVASDTLLVNQSGMVKALGTGIALSAAEYAYHGDRNWTIWLPLGTGSYLLSKWLMWEYRKMQKAKKMQAQQPPAGDVTAAQFVGL